MTAIPFKVNEYSRLDVASKWRLTESSSCHYPTELQTYFIMRKSPGKIFPFSEENIPVAGYDNRRYQN